MLSAFARRRRAAMLRVVGFQSLAVMVVAVMIVSGVAVALVLLHTDSNEAPLDSGVGTSSLRLDFTTPAEVVAASSAIVEATLISETQMTIAAPADATRGLDLVRSFQVQRVLRDTDTVVKDSQLEMYWGIQSTIPLGNGRTVVEKNPAPLAVTGRTYVLFLTQISRRDGSKVLGPVAEPAMAEVTGTSIAFLASDAYKDDLASQGLGGAIPSAFEGITLDALDGLIKADDATKAAPSLSSSPTS